MNLRLFFQNHCCFIRSLETWIIIKIESSSWLLTFIYFRVGFNFGDVTAGVIGTTKLHYDIWGDAVNIASRMDSTGVPNRIQVPSSCIEVLSSRYTFEPRGTVYVKGKDHMEVHLVTGRKDLLNKDDSVSWVVFTSGYLYTFLFMIAHIRVTFTVWKKAFV